jgi:cytidine deaminase
MDLAFEYSIKRSKILNENNGKAYMSCIIIDKVNHNVIQSGINYYNINKKYISLHAEVNAVNNLVFTKKKKKINIFVFRTNKQGNILTMSKPCENCIEYMCNNIHTKGYKLHNIYYTDFDGQINIYKK